ncbi:MAG: YeiH family protein [Acidipropionibacterium sp.]|nr:YeiH family protein [Acidipropionibacterium sp.]
MALAIVLWLAGSTLDIFAPHIPKWSSWPQLGDALAARWPNIIALFVLYGAIFSLAVHFLGVKVGSFLRGYVVLFLLSVVIVLFSQWTVANRYNLEAPIVALVLGLIIGNLARVPSWFGDALRTELYVKVGVILLGATLPFTLVVKAGPIALLQASIIAVATFLVIYFVGVKGFHLDKRFAATLAAGGSICGVSASIAVGSAVKSKKEHVSAALSLVVVWAVIAIFLLTAVAKLIGLPNGVAGAWIGTSEFADAAGITAASSFGEAGIQAFTLVKVVGRDIFIGVWSLILALIAVNIWDKQDRKAGPDRGRPGAQEPGVGEVPQVRDRLLRGVDSVDGAHRGRRRGSQRRDRRSRDDADQGAAHLGLHLHLPVDRPHHSVPRADLGRMEAGRHVQHRRRRQHRARSAALRGLPRPVLGRAGAVRMATISTTTHPPLTCTWTVSVRIARRPDGDRSETIIAALADRFDGWSVRRRRRETVLSIRTDAVDAPAVEAALRQWGIPPAEAAVSVQYARRWGVL